MNTANDWGHLGPSERGGVRSTYSEDEALARPGHPLRQAHIVHGAATSSWPHHRLARHERDTLSLGAALEEGLAGSGFEGAGGLGCGVSACDPSAVACGESVGAEPVGEDAE